MLAIVGASGKLGFATLSSLVEHQLIPPHEVVCTTSSDGGAAKLEPFRQRGVHVRRANWDDEASWEPAVKGVDKLFLISSSRIDKEFIEPYPSVGYGREGDHFKALVAAKKAGVKHVYYTSLAFHSPSKSKVMTAHIRTEAWLRESGLDFTIIREGLYNESWPLYFGYFQLPHDDRTEIVVAGDSPISWTSIADLGVASALILTDSPKEWAGKTLYLCQRKAHSLSDVAKMVSKAKGREVRLKVVSRGEHEEFYTRTRAMDERSVNWWSPTYDALKDVECEINDRTLEDLLMRCNQRPESVESTIRRMFGQA